jgi:hypothetical protein
VKRLLPALFHLFPPAFRRRFASEIAAQLTVGYDRARRRGRRAASGFALVAAIDLVRSAVAERFDPTWIEPRARRAKETEMRGTVEAWRGDLRLAARALRRAPGFTGIAAGTLALAIGATAACTPSSTRCCSSRCRTPRVDRLVHVGASAPGSDFPAEFGCRAEFYLHYREQSTLLEDVSTYNSFTSTLRTPDRVERIRMSQPTYTLFTTLGAQPLLGRLPTAEDGEECRVLSHALWQSWFGGDPGARPRLRHQRQAPRPWSA